MSFSKNIFNNIRHENYISLVYSIYTILSTAFYGWQLIAFIISYSDLNEVVINIRLNQWIKWQPWAIAALFLINTIVYFYRTEILKVVLLDRYRFMLHWKIQIGVLGLALLNFLLLSANVHIHFLELLGFSITVWAILILGFQFYHSPNPAWHHPTTIGSVIISSILLGLSIIAVTQQFEPEVMIPVHYFIVFIFFDMFVFFARFRFLSKTSQLTNHLARRLMGSLLLFTGIRIIIGIFMPLVYSIFMLISDQYYTQGIGLMIIIGLFFDRFLFICPTLTPLGESSD
jgi:hypothetical protein